MNEVSIKGRFIAYEIRPAEAGGATPVGVFPNEITSAGVQRILELMGGQSNEAWRAIRLVGSGGEFIERPVSTEVKPGALVSNALFEAGDLAFDPVVIQMYSGTTKVAEAAFEVSGGRTLFVERVDELSKG